MNKKGSVDDVQLDRRTYTLIALSSQPVTQSMYAMPSHPLLQFTEKNILIHTRVLRSMRSRDIGIEHDTTTTTTRCHDDRRWFTESNNKSTHNEPKNQRFTTTDTHTHVPGHGAHHRICASDRAHTHMHYQSRSMEHNIPMPSKPASRPAAAQRERRRARALMQWMRKRNRNCVKRNKIKIETKPPCA